MKTKNLIFLTLLISVLMVSVVSASITGYLVSRGGALAEKGYTAELQKVDASGVASISVRTPTGETKLVQVQEGETAKVGEAEISASNLKSGTLFRRGGADIGIKTIIDDVVAGPNPIGSATGGVAYSHYHVTSPFFFGPLFFQELKGWKQTDSSFPQPTSSPQEMISITRINQSTPIYDNGVLLGNKFEGDFVCPETDFLVEAGYEIIYDRNNYVLYPDNYVVLTDSPVNLNTYHIAVFQSANAKNKINYIDVNMICGDLEGAEYQNTAHFPPNI